MSAVSFTDEKFKTLEEDEDEGSVLTMPTTWYKRLYWLLSLPLTVPMFITIPDCRKRRWKKWFLVTFIMSIIWISVFSYVMVWMITIVGRSVMLLVHLMVDNGNAGPTTIFIG